MKKIWLATSIVPFLAISAIASPGKSPSLKCVSYDVIDGWTGEETHTRLILTAKVASSDKLLDATLSGAYESDRRDLSADENYKPRSSRYVGMNRFQVLEDAWCNFTLLLPKDMAKAKKFTSYVQMTCESGGQPTIGMFCSVK
jgi:hypothetical protein